jgi:hypothetical protein
MTKAEKKLLFEMMGLVMKALEAICDNTKKLKKD